MQLHRFTIKAAGESGQGVNSVGEILAQSLKESGYYTFGYREYPSLIKGGYSSHQIDISDQPLTSASQSCDVLACLSRLSIHKYLPTVRSNGVVIHSVTKLELSAEEQKWIEQNKLQLFYVPAYQLAAETSGNALMANTIITGLVWKVLNLDLAEVEAVTKRAFAEKPDVIEGNLKCLQAGYAFELEGLTPFSLPFVKQKVRGEDGLVTGNHLLSLGAIAAGVRAYYAYPMTPSSSILSYLAATYHQTGMVVKQIEDEISVAQMALGSMFAGTRALVGTSGGGFDLMTESVSMAAMTETPFVCILGQRPGPATGLPTWTSASDLNLAVYAGHGEFTRCVIAVSDAESCFTVIQQAFNVAEKYQIPVIVLTDKQIAESLFQVENLPDPLPIERHLVPQAEWAQLTDSERFALTDSGISKRWLPGQSDAVFDANSDEHLPDGSITEETPYTQEMYDKRLKKEAVLLEEIPEPEIIGPATAQLTFVGWGSVKNTVVDALTAWNTDHPEFQLNYLHYEYVFPIKTQKFMEIAESGSKIVLIENNAFGQLGALLTQQTGYLFEHKFLKYDGRPFFIEDLHSFLEQEVRN